MSNIFVLLRLFKSKSDKRGKETAIFCVCFVYTANTCCAHSRCAAECQNHTHVFTCDKPAAVCSGFHGSESRNTRTNLNITFSTGQVTPFTISDVAQAKSH